MKKIMMVFWVCALVGLFAAGEAESQTYPARPIQIVVPWAGGDTDLVTRLFSSYLPNYLGQPAVVLNKPGAGGLVGTEFVAKAPADGYTLVSNGPAHLIVPKVQEKAYSLDSFIPLVQMAKNKSLLLVQKDAPWNTLGDFVADAKKNPGTIPYGIPGFGSWHTLMLAIVKDAVKIDIVPVTFPGNAPLVAALLGGHIKLILIEKPIALPHVKGGTLKPLAISEKDADFPGVPTYEEQGVKGDFNNWKALFGRSELPKEVVKVLDEAFQKVLQDKEYVSALAKVGSTVGSHAGESFRNFIREEDKKYAETAKLLPKPKK
jgi:tripartite-type tricarboxylate transporter receptor subunit TctC